MVSRAIRKFNDFLTWVCLRYGRNWRQIMHRLKATLPFLIPFWPKFPHFGNHLIYICTRIYNYNTNFYVTDNCRYCIWTPWENLKWISRIMFSPPYIKNCFLSIPNRTLHNMRLLIPSVLRRSSQDLRNTRMTPKITEPDLLMIITIVRINN